MRQPESNSGEAPKRAPLALIAVLVVVAIAGFFVYRKLAEPPPAEVDLKRMDPQDPVLRPANPTGAVTSKPFESLGAFAADQTVKLIGSSGTIALVIEVPDPNSGANSPMARSINMIAAEADAFKERLKSKGKFTFGPELKLVRPGDAMKTVWPAGVFTKLLNQHSSDTIVAFCHLPDSLTADSKNLLRQRRGKMIVVAGVVPDLQPLVDDRLIQLAIAQKMPIPPAPSSGAETPGQWVTRIHAVLTPGALGQP
jgi:hypothetical protein